MTTYELQKFDFIPEGTKLETEIVNVEERETPFDVDENDPSKGKSVQVSFRFRVIQDGEYQGRILFGNTPAFYKNTTKLGAWVREILSTEELPEKLDLEDLIGLPVYVIVGHKLRNGQVHREYVDQVTRVESDLEYADEAF